MTSPPPPPPALVDDDISLAGLLAGLDAAPEAAVSLDTEADSFHHYVEKLCLIQVGIESGVYLVDPLRSPPLAPLVERLSVRNLRMHGADFDLRLLFRTFRFRARAVFDTMIAAQLLGEKEIGLAALLEKRLSVSLDKAHQRADWSVRPLPPPMVAYAAADVDHLPGLVSSLRADLEATGRLAWHAEECERLVSATFPEARVPDEENGWRLKGTNALTDRERAFVRALWGVREARAEALDLPPFRVLTNERLLHAARLAADGEGDLVRLFPGPRPLPGAFTSEVRRALASAIALPSEAWPKARRREAAEVDPALERAVERLRRERDRKARALKLDPGVLASRGTLTAVARALLDGVPPFPERLAARAGISRWRAEILLGR